MSKNRNHIRTLTGEQLRALVKYDPSTGLFTWACDRMTGRHKNVLSTSEGQEAGYIHQTGYRYICIDTVRYLAHRLAWLYVYDEWPEHTIDHINGERSDNRLANLRDVPQAVNVQNRRNVKGHWKSGAGWKAAIQVNGVSRHIGSYATAEEARAAYLAEKRRLHEGCSI